MCASYARMMHVCQAAFCLCTVVVNTELVGPTGGMCDVVFVNRGPTGGMCDVVFVNRGPTEEMCVVVFVNMASYWGDVC